jgi:predicted small secreted protein
MTRLIYLPVLILSIFLLLSLLLTGCGCPNSWCQPGLPRWGW